MRLSTQMVRCTTTFGFNPDVEYSDLKNPIKKSPVVRNQVYNAHITGFKEMGVTGKDAIPPHEDLETEKTHLSVAIKVL